MLISCPQIVFYCEEDSFSTEEWKFWDEMKCSHVIVNSPWYRVVITPRQVIEIFESRFGRIRSMDGNFMDWDFQRRLF